MMSARWTVTVCLLPNTTSNTATTAMYQSSQVWALGAADGWARDGCQKCHQEAPEVCAW